MKKNKYYIVSIQMADEYTFRKKSKIYIHKENEFYYAASNNKDFGLVKEINEGFLVDNDKLQDKFTGTVIEVNKLVMKIKVKKVKTT